VEEMIREGVSMFRRMDAYAFERASSVIVTTGDGKWQLALVALGFADDDLWPYFKDRVELVLA
jgi:hypothetical protein